MIRLWGKDTGLGGLGIEGYANVRERAEGVSGSNRCSGRENGDGLR